MSVSRLAASVAVSLAATSLSCSYVEIPFPKADGTGYLIARSMELGNLGDVTSHWTELVPAGNHSWMSGKYAYVGMMTSVGVGPVGVKMPLDGMNEQGLTASALAFSQSVYPQHHGESLSVLRVVGRLLAECDSVECAAGFFQTTAVDVGSVSVKSVAGLHWAVADASGRSIVVEYIQGHPTIHENPPRVMTNDPDLEWQWRNLNTHVSLTRTFPDQNNDLQVDTQSPVGAVPRVVGHGWNLFGLPGDFSPPSRFIRLFYLREYALRAQSPKTLADAAVIGTALLNNVFIPLGTVAKDRAVFDRPEFTPYALLKSPQERMVFIRGYRNSQWKLIDLNRLDFTKSRKWEFEDGTLGFQDVTGASEVIL